MSIDATAVAAVVIGRNEGARLRQCLASLTRQLERVVYVDSASTDDSVAFARSLGVHVVELDMSVPFTAARARNAGFDALAGRGGLPRFVQFLDGDCELRETWLARAATVLDARPDLVAVCGRRRERHPEASVYNQLCYLEWNSPVGEARAFGGDVLIRAEAFRAAGGFRPTMIAGEEPELAVRLRGAGWKIWRLDEEMCWHDAAIHRFGQWSKRAVRSGHAYAEAVALHGAPPVRHKRRELLRTLFWGAGLPVLTLLAMLAIGRWAALLLAAYPLQVLRLGWRFRAQPAHPAPWAQAFFLCVAPFPETWGAWTYLARRWSGREARLIEYK